MAYPEPRVDLLRSRELPVTGMSRVSPPPMPTIVAILPADAVIGV
jgi:hypothetical protein